MQDKQNKVRFKVGRHEGQSRTKQPARSSPSFKIYPPPILPAQQTLLLSFPIPPKYLISQNSYHVTSSHLESAQFKQGVQNHWSSPQPTTSVLHAYAATSSPYIINRRPSTYIRAQPVCIRSFPSPVSQNTSSPLPSSNNVPSTLLTTLTTTSSRDRSANGVATR